MIKKIKEALNKNNEIYAWEIKSVESKSSQLFLIKKSWAVFLQSGPYENSIVSRQQVISVSTWLRQAEWK